LFIAAEFGPHLIYKFVKKKEKLKKKNKLRKENEEEDDDNDDDDDEDQEDENEEEDGVNSNWYSNSLELKEEVEFQNLSSSSSSSIQICDNSNRPFFSPHFPSLYLSTQPTAVIHNIAPLTDMKVVSFGKFFFVMFFILIYIYSPHNRRKGKNVIPTKSLMISSGKGAQSMLRIINPGF
jgi:hypothetical protein